MADNFGAGFLFGNVDKEGRLESDDVFDDDEKKHLAGLSSITVGGVIDQFNKESKKLLGDDDHGYDMVPPSPKFSVSFCQNDVIITSSFPV